MVSFPEFTGPTAVDVLTDALTQWAVIGGFCLALAGSVVTVIGFVITLKVTQHDHARRLSSMEAGLRQFLTRMETLERGMAVLLQRSGRKAVNSPLSRRMAGGAVSAAAR